MHDRGEEALLPCGSKLYSGCDIVQEHLISLSSIDSTQIRHCQIVLSTHLQSRSGEEQIIQETTVDCKVVRGIGRDRRAVSIEVDGYATEVGALG